MKTKNVVTILLGTIGTLLLGIGMSIVLVPEFDALVPGIIVGALGLISILAIIPIWVRTRKLSLGLIVSYLIGVIGALLLGISLTHVISDTALELSDFLVGLAYGVPGILICAMNPIAFRFVSIKREKKGENDNV